MSQNHSEAIAELRACHQDYPRQKCFLAYSEQAEWTQDLLAACREVLEEFGLEPDSACQHFEGDVPLRQKVLELIANARYGIYDLSCWRNGDGPWYLPRNVFIELGMAIALNRPTLLLRHESNKAEPLPRCLQGLDNHIVRFRGKTTLKEELRSRLPQWIDAPPEQGWWSRFCIFGGRRCPYREVHPRAAQWEQKELHCHICDSPDGRADFRAAVTEVMEPYRDLRTTYHDALPLAADYTYRMCSHCQTIRSAPFALFRIAPDSPAETFLAFGMSLALEAQFSYHIPRVPILADKRDAPSLLDGYEFVEAKNDTETERRLGRILPSVLQKVREAAWRPTPLPFTEVVPITATTGLMEEKPDTLEHEEIDAWRAQIEAKYPIGSIHKGKVIGVTDAQATIQLDASLKGSVNLLAVIPKFGSAFPRPLALVGYGARLTVEVLGFHFEKHEAIITIPDAPHRWSPRARIYSLARDFGMVPRDLVSLCRAAGIDVKNQQSALEPEQVAVLRWLYGGYRSASNVDETRKKRPSLRLEALEDRVLKISKKSTLPGLKTLEDRVIVNVVGKDRVGIMSHIVDLLRQEGKSTQSPFQRMAETYELSPAVPTPPSIQPKLARNASCWCGSGKKYKHCHRNQDLGEESSGAPPAPR